MSPRNFARAFRKRETRHDAGRVRGDGVRVEARAASRSSRRDTPVEVVARGNGFGTVGDDAPRVPPPRSASAPPTTARRFKSTQAA